MSEPNTDPSGAELIELASDLTAAAADHGNEEIVLLFDTADVMRSIRGYLEYIKSDVGYDPDVDRVKFEKPQALVSCLLSEGYLGKFSMLPAHQAELLGNLVDNSKFDRFPAPSSRQAFIKALTSDPPFPSIDRDSTDDQIREYLRQHSGPNAKRFFKTLQCIRLHWWERLQEMRSGRQDKGKERIWVPIPDDYGIDRITESRYTYDLYEAFRFIRGDSDDDHSLTINNACDAAALSMLAKISENCRNEGKPVNFRFYDPDNYFRNASRRAGLDGLFNIRSDAERSDHFGDRIQAIRSVFVGTNYMVYRAFLHSKPRSEVQNLLENLPKTEDIAAATDASAPGTDQTVKPATGPSLTGSEAKDRAVKESIERWRDLEFLSEVWLKTLAVSDVRDAQIRWGNDELFLEDEFREKIEQVVEDATNDVLSKGKRLRYYSNTWSRLQQCLQSVKKSLKDPTVKDPFDLMLLRIPSPGGMSLKIRLSLNALVGDQQGHGKTSLSESWNHLFRPLRNMERHISNGDYSSIGAYDAELAACILWMTSEFHWLYTSLRHYARKGDSFFVSATHAGAALHLNRNRRSEQLLRRLDGDFARSTRDAANARDDSRTRFSKNGSLAYLWFKLWKNYRGTAWWRSSDLDDLPPTPRGLDNILAKAVHRIDAAWQNAIDCGVIGDFDSQRAHERERTIYLTNQRLYYLVEQGSTSRIRDMNVLVKHMERLKSASSSASWRPEYDDTISRYNAFRAECSDSEERWSFFHKTAKSFFEPACDKLRSGAAMEYRSYLARMDDDGFLGNAYNTGRGPIASKGR